MRASFWVLLWAVFALSAALFAQGHITVNVSDGAGPAVPAAHVAILCGGRETTSATTDEEGEASLASGACRQLRDLRFEGWL